MSTTYTSNLKLGKPASGDTGWGNVVNNELTDMIEQAVVGMATINTWVDATNTHNLTTANGSTSESRCAILQLTDTGTQLSGAGTVIVQDVTKLYAVLNSSGQNVTVKTAGGSGILVKSGNQLNVVCDGTNVIEQDTYSNNLVAAAMQSDSLVLASGATVTEIADEDTMSSNSATKLATQQSIKAYADATGSIRRTEIIKPWANSETITGDALPYQTIGPGSAVETIAEFRLYGNSRTVAQELDLNINGQLIREGWGPGVKARRINAWVVVERVSKSATGTSIGTVTVADVAASGDASSYYKKVEVTGDFTHLIDSFTSIGTSSAGANKKPVTNATYNPTTNRTSIFYDSGLGATGIFGSTGATVFISASGFLSPGSYVVANPENISRLYVSSNMVTFDISNYVSPSVDGSPDDVVDTRKSIQLPKLRLAPNGTAGDVDIRVRMTTNRLGYDGEYNFYSLQVDQTNITRPI